MRMAMIVLAIAIMSEQNRKIKLAINLARLQLILVQSALLFVGGCTLAMRIASSPSSQLADSIIMRVGPGGGAHLH